MDEPAPFDHLSWLASVSMCFTFSIVYVLALYLLSPSNQRYERNHPTVIRRRFLAVAIVCSLTYLFLKLTSNPRVHLETWLGFRWNISSIWTLVGCPVLLTSMLYLGPLVQWLYSFNWRFYRAHVNYVLSAENTHERLIFARNYFVAPFTEGMERRQSTGPLSSLSFLEFVFRSSMLCVLYTHVSLSSAIFISPLFFGLAHLHHMLEHFYRNSHENDHRLPPWSILFIHFFQFTYTYIFGVYSSFLFLRTGHFIPPFLVHALCNCLGLPDLSSLFDRRDRRVKRKVFFAACYVIGVCLFSTNLFFLTQAKFYFANASDIHYRQWAM